MARLVKIVIVLGLLWSGYWYVAGASLRGGIEDWFETRRAEGWQADYAAISTSGYPLRHMTLLEAPALADPATGTAWSADWLMFESPAIWPGRQTVHVSPDPQRFSYFDQTVTLTMQEAQAVMNLHPGLALEVETLALTSGPWQVQGKVGPVMEANSLTLSAVQSAEEDARYGLTAQATDFTPGPGLRDRLQRAARLPREFSAARVEMEVTFDRPWDRSALEESRPQPRLIDLSLAELEWGALRLFATGTLTVDETGTPEGEIALKAENWRDMLAMAEAAGAVPPGAVEPISRVLGLLAGIGGNETALDATLTFEGGMTRLGPLPVGPAPRIMLR